MVLKRLIGLAFVGALAFSAASAEVVVRIAPPRVVVQKRDHSPGRGYMWVQGYQNWDGEHYVWVPGRWEQPPRANARWVKHRWNHQRNGWVMVEGHWR
jgi:hypothetical protein